MLRKLAFVNLYTKNSNKLIKFYKEVVGLKVLPDNESNWFGFDTGNTKFAIEPQSNRKSYKFKFNDKNPILIQFRFKSLNELRKATKELEKNKVIIKQKLLKKSYGTVTTFLDPDNNVIEFLFDGN